MTKVLTSQGGVFTEVDIPTPTRGYVMVDFGAGKTIASTPVWTPIPALGVPMAQVAAYPSPDHTADEAMVEEIEVRAGPPVAGLGFMVYARTRNTALTGKFVIAWTWS